jgi:poly-gamma-glutamate synthesis protein (capsule biosynthesis protein)
MKTLWMGDLSPTVVTDPLFEQGDTKALFNDMVSLFEGNDVNFVNLECALTRSEKSIEKFGPPLKASPNTANVLKQVGVTVCGLSNNHIFDFGVQGAIDTLRELDKAGISYTGFGADYQDSREDLEITVGDEQIAVIAVCEHEYSYALEDRMGSRPYDEYDTMEDIRRAKAENDRVIVIYHGGKEHCKYPSPRLLKLCRAMVKNGADVVLCQHSHCIGCYEKYLGGHILYGQGNFHFVKPAFSTPELEKTWNNSLAVKYDTETNKIEFVPMVVEGSGMALAKGEEKQAIMDAFEARNKQLANGTWVQGWQEFCQSVKEMYTNAVAGAFAPGSTEIQDKLFGHYLDCEAHTDVWRELFKTANHFNEK